jgi:uncharacterized protein YecE (DUF72 family)
MNATAKGKSGTAAAPAELFTASSGPIDGVRVGIGGWTYAPWRSNFYPPGLVQRRELEYASRHVNAIEINGTYYGTQKPETYRKWRDETPPGFVFSAKAPKRIMASRTLAKTGPQIEDFVGGIVELGDRLGPLVWQFDQGTRLQREDFTAFLGLLPKTAGDRKLRHVLDVRDRAFVDAAFLALAREHGCATVFTDSPEHPSFADLTADFVYARLMRARAEVASGYDDGDLARWARRARTWAQGGEPDDLPRIEAPADPTGRTRDVFLYFISAAKERNPAAAMSLLRHLGS